MSEAWSVQQKKQIWALLKVGYNLREIACVMGRGKNSVIGIVWRTPALKAANQERVANTPHANKRKPPHRRLKGSDLEEKGPTVLKPTFVAPPSPNLRPEAYDAKSLQVRLLDLKSNQCKYIAGYDHLSCGWPVKEGFVYCAHHMARCRSLPHYAKRAS